MMLCRQSFRPRLVCVGGGGGGAVELLRQTRPRGTVISEGGVWGAITPLWCGSPHSSSQPIARARRPRWEDVDGSAGRFGDPPPPRAAVVCAAQTGAHGAPHRGDGKSRLNGGASAPSAPDLTSSAPKASGRVRYRCRC